MEGLSTNHTILNSLKGLRREGSMWDMDGLVVVGLIGEVMGS